MKKFLIIIGLTLASLPAYAQKKPVLHLSLQKAMKIGLKNRYDVKADKYNIFLASNKLRESKKVWIPNIHATGDVTYNMQLQPTYVPKGFIGLTQPEILSFGAKNMSVFGLELTEPIFRPGISTNVKIARKNLSLQKERNHEAKIDIKDQIAVAYLNVLLKKLQSRMATNDENRFKKYYELASGKYHDGSIIKNEYLRVRLDYKNAQIQAATSKQNYNLSLANFKYQINVPKKSKVVLTDSIAGIKLGPNRLTTGYAVANRSEIKLLKFQNQIDKLQLRKARQFALPSISLFANYSQQFLSDNFNYGDSRWWSPFSYMGIRLSIPITSNISNHNNIEQYKLKAEQTDWEIRQEKSTINYQVQSALTKLHNARFNMQTAKKNYKLSQTIYANQKKQFKIGAFQYERLLNTENSLSKAEQNYIETVYHYLLVELNYMKATAQL